MQPRPPPITVVILFSVWQLRRHCLLLPLLPFSLLPTPSSLSLTITATPNLSTLPTTDLPLLPHISFSSSPHRQRRYPHSSHTHLIPFPVSLSPVPVSLSHNKPPSSVIFSVGLPSLVPANTPGADLALTNLPYCSSSDRHNFAVPGSKLFLSVVANSGSVCQ